MGKRNSDDDRKKKWEERPLIDPSTLVSQSNGTGYAIDDSMFAAIRDSLPESMREMFDEYVNSLRAPKPR